MLGAYIVLRVLSDCVVDRVVASSVDSLGIITRFSICFLFFTR